MVAGSKWGVIGGQWGLHPGVSPATRLKETHGPCHGSVAGDKTATCTRYAAGHCRSRRRSDRFALVDGLCCNTGTLWTRDEEARTGGEGHVLVV